MNRQPIQRKTPMKRGKPLRRVSKNNWWERLRPKLKVEFVRSGIVRCEVCGGEFSLGFAHAEKRRFITTRQQQQEVALLCHDHHGILERMKHALMAAHIRIIIDNRETPVRYVP